MSGWTRRWVDGWPVSGWVDGSGSIVILTLQVGKLRHRRVKRFATGHGLGRGL